jgi:hypothetical protein
MISLYMHHRQFGTQQYVLSAEVLSKLPPATSEDQVPAALARLLRLAPKVEAGWEFEIVSESLQEAV